MASDLSAEQNMSSNNSGKQSNEVHIYVLGYGYSIKHSQDNLCVKPCTDRFDTLVEKCGASQNTTSDWLVVCPSCLRSFDLSIFLSRCQHQNSVLEHSSLDEPRSGDGKPPNYLNKKSREHSDSQE